MHFIQPAVYLLLSIALVGCTSAPVSGPEKDKTYRITVMHTNDHHGRFWKNSEGEYGMAARKTVIDRIRDDVAANGGYSLLLDGGDVNTGIPESDLQDAVPDFKGMNLLGYQAMAVGNHEFDKPRAVLEMQRQLAQFPMLSANIYEHGERLFAPYKIFNLGGVRVGVMGLTTEDTYKMVHPDHVANVEFRSVIAEATQVVPELRRQADVVIAATHMGHYENGHHGTQAMGDVEMARAVNGIDLVVGGHSQNPACMKAENVLDRAYVPASACTPDRQNGTWIVQAHEWGKYVGRADFEYRNGNFKLVHYALIPVNLKSAPQIPQVAEDPTMLTLLSPYQAFGQRQLGLDIGETDRRLEGERAILRTRPAAMGTLVARAMMEKTKADFAVINAGGVRDSLAAGKITYKDVLKVHPFGNTLVTVDFTGTEVMAYLNVVAQMTPGSGAFAQFAGIRLDIVHGAVTHASLQGLPIESGRMYRLVVNSFQAAGGDGYPPLTNHPSFVNTRFVDADVLRAYIAAHSPLKASDFESNEAVLRR